jgi:hypothetical protein
MLGGPAAWAQNADALEGWTRYVNRTETRMGAEIRGGLGWPSQHRQDIDERGVSIERLETRDAEGDAIDTPGAMVHHWRGTVFVPGVNLVEVLRVVEHPERDVELQEDVLEARVLERGADTSRVFLKLERSKIVTAVFNTEHTVTFTRHSDGRVSSRTVATKIAELDDPGTPQEREKPPGDDRGFLWKLNSYWRYEEVEGGVLIACESISLSRSIPFLARPFVRPIVEGVARESLERTLVSLRGRLTVR